MALRLGYNPHPAVIPAIAAMTIERQDLP